MGVVRHIQLFTLHRLIAWYILVLLNNYFNACVYMYVCMSMRVYKHEHVHVCFDMCVYAGICI